MPKINRTATKGTPTPAPVAPKAQPKVMTREELGLPMPSAAKPVVKSIIVPAPIPAPVEPVKRATSFRDLIVAKTPEQMAERAQAKAKPAALQWVQEIVKHVPLTNDEQADLLAVGVRTSEHDRGQILRIVRKVPTSKK